MAHSCSLINGNFNADLGSKAASRSFLRFVEDTESLELEIYLGNSPWGSAKGCSGSGLLTVPFFTGEEAGEMSHVKGYAGFT